MSRPSTRPLLAGAAAGLVAVLALLLVGSGTRADPPSDPASSQTPCPPRRGYNTCEEDGTSARTSPPGPPPGAALTEQDRGAVAAVPVRRGVGAPVDPRVDLTDPASVARAYLAAAHSVGPADAGHTQLRAAGYAEPDSPAATVGVVVVDPPPPGSTRIATVTSLELVAVDAGDGRRGYRAEIGTATGPAGGAQAVDIVAGLIVLARQPDGAWLVTADTPDLPAGED